MSKIRHATEQYVNQLLNSNSGAIDTNKTLNWTTGTLNQLIKLYTSDGSEATDARDVYSGMLKFKIHTDIGPLTYDILILQLINNDEFIEQKDIYQFLFYNGRINYRQIHVWSEGTDDDISYPISQECYDSDESTSFKNIFWDDLQKLKSDIMNFIPAYTKEYVIYEEDLSNVYTSEVGLAYHTINISLDLDTIINVELNDNGTIYTGTYKIELSDNNENEIKSISDTFGSWVFALNGTFNNGQDLILHDENKENTYLTGMYIKITKTVDVVKFKDKEVSGSLVKEINSSTDTELINIEDLDSGLYVLSGTFCTSKEGILISDFEGHPKLCQVFKIPNGGETHIFTIKLDGLDTYFLEYSIWNGTITRRYSERLADLVTICNELMPFDQDDVDRQRVSGYAVKGYAKEGYPENLSIKSSDGKCYKIIVNSNGELETIDTGLTLN